MASQLKNILVGIWRVWHTSLMASSKMESVVGDALVSLGEAERRKWNYSVAYVTALVISRTRVSS